jgi:hypothetical protein
VRGDVHFGIELHLAGVETLEQQVKRHDLGERGGMADAVGAVGRQRGAGIAVDDDRGELRAVALARHVLRDVVPRIVTVAAGFGAVAGGDDRSGEGDQPENANSQRARGSQGCTKHLLPRPNFYLDHRFVRRNCAHRPGDVALLETAHRAAIPARSADQVAILAKVLFTNGFHAVCRKANKSEDQVRRSEFPKA